MTQKETRMIKDVQLTLVSDVSMSQYDCGHSRTASSLREHMRAVPVCMKWPFEPDRSQ